MDDLTADRLSQIYEKFSGGGNLGDAFRQRFNTELEEESLNLSHQIIIVAAELDPSTERIVDYLSKNGISINVLFFKVFQHGDEQFLSRAWLIDPSETQTNAAQATATNANAKEPRTASFTFRLAIQTAVFGRRLAATDLLAQAVGAGTARP